MANELQPLSQLFQNRLFRIPDYQRGYAWQQEQLVDFWDDLINLQPDRYHYTGLLSLKNLKLKDVTSWGNDLWLVDNGFKPCHIVDGQQRLTTFIILVNEIVTFVSKLPENIDKNDKEVVLGYETIRDIKEKYIAKKRPPQELITTYLFGYEIDNPSAEYLRYKIFCEPYSGTVRETYYTKNLKNAKQFFANNVAKFYAEEGIEGLNFLYRKLTQKLMFNIHEIEDDYDVFVAFETMNNRGKKLTNLELLKNRLIYLTTLYSDKKLDEKDKDELRRQINDAWKEVYYQLGRNEMVPLSDDEFLRAHWIIYFTYSRYKGDDYIRFLLRRFSAKNIFEKKTIVLEETQSTNSTDDDFDDDFEDETDVETKEILKLEPHEIRDYVNSMKDIAKYWYATFFPYESEFLTEEEKLWIDRLNRIGIGYFRPLITTILAKATDSSADERVETFKAIENFIFVAFRLGGFNASYLNSVYYKSARDVYIGEETLQEIIDYTNEKIDEDSSYALNNFINKNEQRFNKGEGYYAWKSLKYFLYEYEYNLAVKYGIDKINWDLFTKTEKDMVTVEHILPQTPTKYYWKNLYRQFSSDEIKKLSGALGNLLPLSQSVNSALQNDSFVDKKHSKTNGRRGYENGSHSEIEVSQNNDWTAVNIYKRSVQLIQFMKNRWNINITDDECKKLIGVEFVKDGRMIPPELDEDEFSFDNNSKDCDKLGEQQVNYWSGFAEYCNQQGRMDLSSRKPFPQNWYEVPVSAPDFIICYTMTYGKYLSLVIYVYNPEAFARIESKKSIIEKVFGAELDWYSSREKSTHKRIIYKKEVDFSDTSKRDELYSWMIEYFDKLQKALEEADEKYN